MSQRQPLPDLYYIQSSTAGASGVVVETPDTADSLSFSAMYVRGWVGTLVAAWQCYRQTPTS